MKRTNGLKNERVGCPALSGLPPRFPLFVCRWRLAVASLSCLFGLFIPLLLLLPQHPWQTFVTRMDAVIKKSLTVTSCLLKRTKKKGGNRFSLLKAYYSWLGFSADIFARETFSFRSRSSILL